MLDDLKFIHNRDSKDALGIAAKQADQFLHNFKFDWQPPNEIHEIIVVGMGGSGLAAKAYRGVNDLNVPVLIIQDYDLPDRVGANTLLICSSYSGNTEEVLSVFEQVFDEKRAYPMPMVVVVSSGGKLLELAESKGLPAITLPSGIQPRYTFGYQYRALAEIIASTSLVDGEIKTIESAAKQLPSFISEWLPDVPISRNPAKRLALELVGKSPVIYASSGLFTAAYKWKISFNENAKNIAWCNEFPEFNHNEFLGWSSHPIGKPYGVVYLQSSFDHPQVTRRFEATARLLSGKMPHPEIVQAQSDTLVGQLFYLVAFGDFVSLYLALLNNLDPTPVDLIEKLKVELG